jgi:hypothetical protein
MKVPAKFHRYPNQLEYFGKLALYFGLTTLSLVNFDFTMLPIPPMDASKLKFPFIYCKAPDSHRISPP